MGKLRDFYQMKPGAGIYQTEFGYYSLDKWIGQGHLPEGVAWPQLSEIFGFDPSEKYSLGNLGWCEAAFSPEFEEKVLRTDGDYEIVQDFAGRGVKCFKGRRNGFMPEYVDHPVKDMKSFEEKCLWRMDAKGEARRGAIERSGLAARQAQADGKLVTANLVGGYMYLRSLMGPTEVMYMFYDDPALVHACMRTWFELADAITAEHQKYASLDEIFLAEDICYKQGLLISKDMVREFLFPYYQQFIENAKKRQADKARTVHIQVDTDGFSDPAIDLYREIGLDYLSPFEVAAGCDVVRTARQYPDLRISGGIDKRILASGKDAIDREIDRILPFMKARGGYYPTCDHGVPEEVPFEDYVHFRKRLREFA
jgi:uroporphyrinogen decarboxylase